MKMKGTVGHDETAAVNVHGQLLTEIAKING